MKSEGIIKGLLIVMVILFMVFMYLGAVEVNNEKNTHKYKIEDIINDKKIDSLQYYIIKSQEKANNGYIYIKDSSYENFILK
ncbi:MAG: hypothetical protein MI739_04765 [Bacteroidales bacterium]|nr:hypothetical protein [Bacteroidales bacterium]